MVNVAARRVCFDKIHIRQYERSLGDNPSVSSGPAIGIGWEYDPEILELDVEQYESSRGVRRKYTAMAVPREIREAILKFECGCSGAEVASCIREINAIKAKRRQTMTNLQFAAIEERIEELTCSIRKMVCLKKSEEEEMFHLWKASNSTISQNN